jgi:hypothetical protein
MYYCIHDPGLAIFLAESSVAEDGEPGLMEWTALVAVLVVAVVALAVPA